MKTIIIIFLMASGICFSQSYKIEKMKGNVEAQIGTSENWVPVKSGDEIRSDAVLSTGKSSYVQIQTSGSKFMLDSYSALRVASIKKMSINDLILALAMEDMMNAPKKNEKINSQNTAVYGAEINGVKSPMVESDDLGIKKLNGAVQLAENGFKESAVVVAKETFRKYPETKTMAKYRIYFADILFNLGLNEDAYDEFKSIDSLNLKNDEKADVKSKLDILTKKLMSN